MKIFTNIRYEKFPPIENILYFSPHAPDYDKSSGGNRLLQILSILSIDLNYKIYFICNNNLDEKYTNKLEDIGITTFSLNNSNIETKEYIISLKNSGINCNHAIFSWYDSAYQYSDIVKEIYPNIKTIVDSVDIHWLRESRGKKDSFINISEQYLINKKLNEIECYADADVVFAITKNEQKEINKMVGYHKNTKILSNIHESNQLKKLGNDIVFIGGFAHSPNISAAIQSIEIFKKFRKTKTYKLYKPKLYIVGPDPHKKIKKAKGHCSDIVITGKIESLNDIHQKTKVSMSPLSWGAGIKGKICDASMHNIPILTSDIGNEGIDFINNEHAFIANDTKEFVDHLCNIYSMSEDKLYSIANNGKNHISKIVSKEAAINVLKYTLEAKKIIICIVTYNKPKMLENCINSIIEKTKYPNYEIVIIDNSDNNETTKYIKSLPISKSKYITYKKNKKNEYFGKPNNDVILDPLYKDCDIVLVNDDIGILSECWLTRLYSTAYSSYDIGAVGGKTIFPNGLLAEAGAELYNTGYGKNIGRNEDPNLEKYSIPKSVGYCSGCLLYLKRDVLNIIGHLDERFYPMYYEDTEWQYRAHLHGYKTIYEPKCIAIHAEGSSAGTDVTKGMKRYQEINRLKFIEKYKNLDIEQYNK
jgi:GT2 family glycosyltransferase/glycosyltransferase involved in cell wall biosynthesis